MTDAELRQEVDALKQRVRQLEQLLDGGGESPSQHSASVGDHRDAAVLDVVEDMAGAPGPRQTLNLYLKHTDISNRDTAKRRAKQLRRTDAYTEAAGI